MLAHTRVWFLCLLMVWALSHASRGGAQEEKDAPSPAEKIRKALDQTMPLDYTGGTLADVIQHLKEKTRVNFLIDALVLQQMGIGMDNGLQEQIHLKSDRNTKVRTALQRMLNPHNLSYVVLEDSVLITTEEVGLHRQMRQRVSVDYKGKPLGAALKELARTTGLNVILDPRVKADEKVSLQLDDATLETAVRLLAEMGGLKSIRMGNVLFITDEIKAEKLRKEDMQQQGPVPPNVYPMTVYGVPRGIGGFGGIGVGLPQPVTPERAKQFPAPGIAVPVGEPLTPVATPPGVAPAGLPQIVPPAATPPVPIRDQQKAPSPDRP